jgi:hypothetical protein
MPVGLLPLVTHAALVHLRHLRWHIRRPAPGDQAAAAGPGGLVSAPVSDGPAGRARWWLCESPGASDAAIALAARTGKATVQRVRRELVGLGVIPARHSGPQTVRGKEGADRCRAALLDDPTRTNAEIAVAEGVDVAQVGGVRRSLVNLGVIAPQRVTPARFPQHVPMPRAPRVLQEGLCVGHPMPRGGSRMILVSGSPPGRSAMAAT